MLSNINYEQSIKMKSYAKMREKNIAKVKLLQPGDKVILNDGSIGTYVGVGAFPGYVAIKERPCESIPADRIRM